MLMKSFHLTLAEKLRFYTEEFMTNTKCKTIFCSLFQKLVCEKLVSKAQRFGKLSYLHMNIQKPLIS